MDELTRKIKANLKLSEEEIDSDTNSEKEDFVKGAMIISQMEAPRVIKRVNPIYPEIARQARVEGMVLLNTRVDKQGNVEAIQVLRSIPLLDQAAIDAFKEWKYEPMIVDGKAIPVIFTVYVRFGLK